MILMNDFQAESADIKDEMNSAVERVIHSGWFVLGKEVETFERSWADVCGVDFGVGVANGMDAIEIALRALGVGPGDEVITSPMTAFATVLAILRSGAIPVLADIHAESALLNQESVSRCVTSKTKAVILVHLYGQVRDMEEWQLFCEESNIHLVEDCAQSHLATWKGNVAGSFGEAGAYSFYPTKNLGTFGDGGMLVTSNEEIAKQARCLRNYGQSVRYHHPEIGMNSRLDEVHAAILQVRLKWLVGFTHRRQEIAQMYSKGIANPLIKKMSLPQETSAHSYHLYVITSKQRDALKIHLEKCEIQTYFHYPIPIHHQKSCEGIVTDRSGLGVSENHARECLSLPCHPQMTNDNVFTIINAVNDFKL